MLGAGGMACCHVDDEKRTRPERFTRRQTAADHASLHSLHGSSLSTSIWSQHAHLVHELTNHAAEAALSLTPPHTGASPGFLLPLCHNTSVILCPCHGRSISIRGVSDGPTI